MADDSFLKQAYQLKNTADTIALYQEWAESYDSSVREHGYVTPERCVAALQRHQSDKNVPILDVGCGTGISGYVMYQAGYHYIDGSDVSQAMLDKAALLGDIYHKLHLVNLDNPFDFEKGTYHVITAMGVIADKHAPPETIIQLLEKLEAGGLLIFSLNNHTLENPAYEQTAFRAEKDGLADILEAENGPHMTGYNMTSKIYVMRRC